MLPRPLPTYSPQAQQRPWSPDDPEGNLILTVAENKLSSDLIHARLSEAPLPPPSALQYADMRGIPALRKAWAETLMSTFMKGHAIDPDHITCSAGAGAILDMLFFCVCSAGDGVLIPAPYYPAFDNDLQVRDRAGGGSGFYGWRQCRPQLGSACHLPARIPSSLLRCLFASLLLNCCTGPWCDLSCIASSIADTGC